jgi:predicted nucleotidyltransferase
MNQAIEDNNIWDGLSLAQTLDRFVGMLHHQFGPRLVSVLLFGSAVFDDLTPGYGDLDFLVVVDHSLVEQDCRMLSEMRQPLRLRKTGNFASMLEGAFLPRHMLDPTQAGVAFWWGTSGERLWQKNRLGWIILHEIRHYGKILWGEDIRAAIPVISQEQLQESIGEVCQNIALHGKGRSLHSVDWLLTAARGLLFLQEGRLCSKSEAADWAYQHARGGWKAYLPLAKQIRIEPLLANTSEVQKWLSGLTAPIQEAGRELQEVLRSL